MISHEHKCIFIHIPKTAGMSVLSFFFPDVIFHHTKPDYERLFGWCPKRRIHMQHATSKQLLEMGLINEEHWKNYFKFTFVRNPWDKAYSDFLWIKWFAKVDGTFKEYLNKKNEFNKIFNDDTNYNYLGDHLFPQTDFFTFEGLYKPDFIGRFENFNNDIQFALNILKINRKFNIHTNKGNRKELYSMFYTNTNKKLIEVIYKKDIELLNYSFDDKRSGFHLIKKLL